MTSRSPISDKIKQVKAELAAREQKVETGEIVKKAAEQAQEKQSEQPTAKQPEQASADQEAPEPDKQAVKSFTPPA